MELICGECKEFPKNCKCTRKARGSESLTNDLFCGKLTKIAANLLKSRLSDFEEDYPKRFPKHVLRTVERHNECIRKLACELIDLKRAI